MPDEKTSIDVYAAIMTAPQKAYCVVALFVDGVLEHLSIDPHTTVWDILGGVEGAIITYDPNIEEGVTIYADKRLAEIFAENPLTGISTASYRILSLSSVQPGLLAPMELIFGALRPLLNTNIKED